MYSLECHLYYSEGSDREINETLKHFTRQEVFSINEHSEMTGAACKEHPHSPFTFIDALEKDFFSSENNNKKI